MAGRCDDGRCLMQSVAHHCAPPSRTIVALWRDESGAGRGIVRRCMRVGAHGRAPTCALAARANFVAAAAGRLPLRRVSDDVATAGLISSRVWFGPVPGSP
ncbi:polycomb enhancer protein [Dorcoceras hygrometricum]|uniref:Polycomb enhancer protein n=1 Tax=Dorcoceras hygrometricum TaxID=472368 RepID=A0A2Z6ZSX2_9LAMI|nr:polycomb enhancer protein [Dorcoceras hygrometricum]